MSFTMANAARSSASRLDDTELVNAIEAVYLQAEALLSETSISSTATASDLTGAGRNLGNLYSFLGRRLEIWINRVAVRLGYGPEAIQERVLYGPEHYRLCLCVPLVPQSGSTDDRKLKRDLKRLISYADSNIKSNRELAFQAIASIVIADPYFSESLKSLGVSKIVGLACLRDEQDQGRDCLLSPSRKALICLIETRVNAAAHELLKRDPTLRTTDKDSFERLLRLRIIIVKHIGSNSPDISFLAILHLTRHCNVTKWLKRSEGNEIPVLAAFADQVNGLVKETTLSLQSKIQDSPQTVDWTLMASVTSIMQVYGVCANFARPQCNVDGSA